MLAAMNLPEWLTVGGLAAAALIAVVGLGVAAWGLFDARSLLRRELSAYFLSPVAYVVFFVFLAVTAFLFYLTIDELTATGPRGVEYPMQYFFGNRIFWLVFVFIPPVLTMRLFAEERSSGTLEMLMTAPVRDWQVVLCKYTAALIFYTLLWLPTLLYLPALLDLRWAVRESELTSVPVVLIMVGLGLTLLGLVLLIPRVGTGLRVVSLLVLVLGVAGTATGLGMDVKNYHDWRQAQDRQASANAPAGEKSDVPEKHFLALTSQLDPAPVLTSYLGVFLAGAMFLSLGLFVSSLVRNQLVAFMLSIAASIPLVVAGFLPINLDRGGLLHELIYFLSIPLHFTRSFGRGLIDTRHLVLYASVAVFCLFLTVRNLESRRWR